MERFKEAVRSYLKPLEEGKVYYDLSLDCQTLQIVIFPENEKGVLLIDLYSMDENGDRLLCIDNRLYDEKTKLDGETIFKKFLDAINLDFQVEDEKRWRDDCYWMIEKGSFLLKRKSKSNGLANK